jgi:alpha-ketoglutarate-dependent taurine dioxygenase
MSIEIIPTGAALGAEISGVDMAQPIDDAVFAAIERAYNDHGVIFFRDQHITPPQQSPLPAVLARSNSTSSESDGAFPVVPKS